MDKRTKEYKEWVKAQKEAETTGLGDVVEKVAKKTGIKKAVEFVAGEDCGCNERKKKWNKIRLQWQPVRCFTEEQFNWWTKFREENPAKITNEHWNMINEIHKTVFSKFFKKRPSCCIDKHIDRINQLYDKY